MKYVSEKRVKPAFLLLAYSQNVTALHKQAQ